MSRDIVRFCCCFMHFKGKENLTSFHFKQAHINVHTSEERHEIRAIPEEWRDSCGVMSVGCRLLGWIQSWTIIALKY